MSIHSVPPPGLGERRLPDYSKWRPLLAPWKHTSLFSRVLFYNWIQSPGQTALPILGWPRKVTALAMALKSHCLATKKSGGSCESVEFHLNWRNFLFPGRLTNIILQSANTS